MPAAMGIGHVTTGRRTSRGMKRALAVSLVILAPVVLAGCMDAAGGSGGEWRAEAPVGMSPDGDEPGGWRVGSWWAYAATFNGNRTFHVTLVLYEEADGSFTLGSNRSAGFFGLPFNGNVTQPDLNPVIAGDEWPLYRFPLEDGKTWSYEFMGHKLTTRASAVPVEAPGVGKHEGFRLEAGAFGRTVAAYTYSPEVAWFTHLVIYDPADGREVVRVALTDYGRDYSDDFFVQVPLHTHKSEYPDVPDRSGFSVDASYLRLTATALLQGQLGNFRFTLEDPHGREAMNGQVRFRGAFADQQVLSGRGGEWTISESGLGQGSLFLEITGVRAVKDGHEVDAGDVDPGALAAWDEPVPTVNLAALLAGATDAPETGPTDGAPAIVPRLTG